MNKLTVNLTEGSIARGIALFSLPLLLSNLFQQLYNSVDSAVVGRYSGSIALAAVGSTGAMINLLIGFFLGIATGTGVLYAMHFGAGDTKGLKKITDCAMLLSIGVGAVITVFGIIFAPQLLRLMQTPDNVMADSIAYLRIYLAGTIVNLVYNVGAGIIRSAGDSLKPLIYLFISGVSNFILDMLFVAVLDMGAAGAALATVLAQAISAILVLIHLMVLFPKETRYRPFHPTYDKVVIWDIVRISVPCGLQNSMFNISNLLVQAEINRFGSVAMAGITAYSKIDGFVYMPMGALSLACSTYVGQNIGAGRYDRVRSGVRFCMISALIVAAALGGAVFLSCEHVIGIFTTDPEAQKVGLQMMHYLAPFACIFSFSDIFGAAIRGAGEAVKVTIVSALCICVFRLIWLPVMLHFFYDLRIVFLCYPTSWFLSSIVMTIYYFKGSVIHKTMAKSGA